MCLRRLSEFAVPTAAELAELENAKQGRRCFKRNQLISREGRPVTEIYFVAEGWVGSSLEVNFGRKQLAKIYLPGDLAGLPNLAMAESVENLFALTNVTVDTIPLDSLTRLFKVAPRLACMLFVTAQHERVMLMDQLAVVGQSKAIQRVAALILHFHRRLSVLRSVSENVIDWPLSQQRVAEGVGLTNVHVNRTFRELTKRGLIAREGRQLRILDLDRLSELAGLPQRPTAKEPAWLVKCCAPHD